MHLADAHRSTDVHSTSTAAECSSAPCHRSGRCAAASAATRPPMECPPTKAGGRALSSGSVEYALSTTSSRSSTCNRQARSHMCLLGLGLERGGGERRRGWSATLERAVHGTALTCRGRPHEGHATMTRPTRCCASWIRALSLFCVGSERPWPCASIVTAQMPRSLRSDSATHSPRTHYTVTNAWVALPKSKATS